MRQMWRGGWQSHRGKHFAVENARIFTLPNERPAIMVAASKPRATELAGRIGDGLISFEPKADLVKAFQAAGMNKPRYGQLTVCYAASESTALKEVQERWPNAGVGGNLLTDLPLPTRFEEIIELMDPEKIAEGMPLGPNPRRHIDGIMEFARAGFDHIYVHQVGPPRESPAAQ